MPRKEARDRAYHALIWFADKNKDDISPNMSLGDLADELQRQLAPLGLERSVDAGIIPHDGKSLLQWSRDMMKFHGRDRGSVRETLFTDGNKSVQTSFLDRIGYRFSMSRWSTPFQGDSSQVGRVVEHDRSATEQSQNRPLARPTMSPLSERTSPRGSFDEIVIDPSSTTPATAAPAPSEGSTSQRTSDACRPNHDGASLPMAPTTQCLNPRHSSVEAPAHLASASSVSAASTGSPNAPKPSSEPVSKRPCASSAIPAQTEGQNAQQSPSETRSSLPFMGAFSIPDSEVRDKMQSLSQDLQSAVRQLFLSSGIEVGHPAEFEPTPVLELEKLYESALGTKDWRSRAVELQIYGIPRAFDLLTALVGAAVHRWVFEKVHPWRGPVQEYLGSKLHRRHVDRVVAEHTEMELDTLLRLAAVRELQDPAYDSAEVRPDARRLAGDLKLFLAQHLRRLFRNQSEALLHALGEQWSTALTDLFAGALHLVARLKLAAEEYAFAWPGGKEPFHGHSMQSKYSTNGHAAFRQVVIALWPGITVADGEIGIQGVPRACVIAT